MGLSSHNADSPLQSFDKRMNVLAEYRDPQVTRRSSRRALLVSVAAALCLIGAGLLLWWRHGAAVFSDTVLAALAWCF